MIATLCILAQLPHALAADPPARPAALEEDDDDDGDDDNGKPVGTIAKAPAKTGPAARAATLFSPLRVSDWTAEIGLQQRFVSKAGRRRAVEGATGLTYEIVWLNLLFLSSDRGIGAKLFEGAGAFSDRDQIAVGFAFNTDDRDASSRSRSQARAADAKRGTSTFALAFADYKIGRWRAWAELAHFVANGKGHVISLGSEYTLPLTNKWSTTFATGVSFADGTYMRDNFAPPATAPSFVRKAAYITPKAGARDLTVSAELEYRADAHWRWNAVLGFTQSLGASPQGAFTKVRSSPFLSTGVRYRF